MKIKSLLAAVCMAAIAAPAAHAINVSETSGAFTTPLALELNLTANPVVGNVTITISPDGNGFYNQGVQHNVEVNLPAGMTFSGAVPNGAINGNNGATGNIFTGGTNGGSTVTFQIAPLSANTNTFTVTFPVKVGACLGAGSGIQAIVSTAGGFVNNDTDGDNTGSTAGSGFKGCKSAWDGVVNGTTASGTDTFVALANPTYTTLGGDAVLGSITYAIDNTVAVNATGTNMALSDLNATMAVVSTITLPGNPATTTNPASSGATLSATNGTVTGGPVVWTLTQTPAQAVAGSVISITAGTAVLPNMQPTVTTATSKFVTANGFIASEAGATGNLEFIQRQGQSFGVFDWNSGPSGAQTVSVYRVTGLAPGVPVTYTATLYNSFANGTLAPATITGDASGEAVLVSTTLAGIPANVSRYDLGLNFETARALDVDRLMAKEGIISTYGGGANQDKAGNLQNTPSMDADN